MKRIHMTQSRSVTPSRAGGRVVPLCLMIAALCSGLTGLMTGCAIDSESADAEPVSPNVTSDLAGKQSAEPGKPLPTLASAAARDSSRSSVLAPQLQPLHVVPLAQPQPQPWLPELPPEATDPSQTSAEPGSTPSSASHTRTE